jgi:hypothetical protein
VEALNLLFVNPARDPHSSASNLCSGSDCDVFEDWPQVNDMAASVYVALTADALSSHASTFDDPCDVRGSRTGGLSSRQSHSRIALSKKPRQQKTALPGTSQKKLKKTKVDAERALAAPTSLGGRLSTADFNKNECDIMYPRFAHNVLFAFTHMFLFCFIFSYFRVCCLCFPHSSVFSAHLLVLVPYPPSSVWKRISTSIRVPRMFKSYVQPTVMVK